MTFALFLFAPRTVTCRVDLERNYHHKHTQHFEIMGYTFRGVVNGSISPKRFIRDPLNPGKGLLIHLVIDNSRFHALLVIV